MQAPSNGLDPRLTQSALWLYLVAALSAINLIIRYSGGSWQFAVGLGVTKLLGRLGEEFGSLVQPITISVSTTVILLLFYFGIMANRGAIWAFWAGIAVLGLDTLLLLPDVSTMWLSIALHIWAIVSLFSGLKIAREG